MYYITICNVYYYYSYYVLFCIYDFGYMKIFQNLDEKIWNLAQQRFTIPAIGNINILNLF